MSFVARSLAQLAIFTLLSCSSAADTSKSLHDDLAIFVDAGAIKSEGMRLFFSDEAADAGVLKIRAMHDHEKPTEKKHQAQTGCGRAVQKTKEILIDVQRKNCVNLANLAHEIAHFPAKEKGCRGHGDLFYEINEGIAQRFVAKFPGESWGGSSPIGKVRSRALEYRSPC